MRIQIFVQSLSVGGAERVAAMWANGFVNNGNKVSVVLARPLDFPRTYDVSSNINITSIYSGKKGKWNNFYDRLKKTGKEIEAFRPNVILTVNHVEDFAIWFHTRGTRIKIISTEHNSFQRPPEVPMGKHDRLLKYKMNLLFDAVTVLTNADKDIIGSRLKHVFVLPNPLAYEPIYKLHERKKIITAVGRLEAYYVKGFDLLLEAFAKVSMSHTDWMLRIVGSDIDGGKSLNYLKEITKDFCLEDKVEFVEYQKDILPLYQESEIFVLSSRYEGFGLVLIEAMSQGCACIACDYYGRQNEIVNSPSYGIVCPSGDVRALQSALEKLLDDENLRKCLHENAPERAKEYSLNNIMSKWDVILTNIIRY